MRLLVLAFSCAIAFAQKPSVTEILHKAAANLDQATEFHIVFNKETSVADGPVTHVRADVARRGPDRFRFEGSAAPADPVVIAIVNGTDASLYVPKINRYTRATGSSPDVEELRGGVVQLAKVVDTFGEFSTSKNPELVGEELLRTGRESVYCWLIRVESPGATLRAWIDKKRLMPLRWEAKSSGSGEKGIATVELVSSNEPLPDSLFIFEPPVGALEVKSLKELWDLFRPKQ